MQKYYLYIVLTRTNTFLSRLIQIFTKSEFTHAAISLDKELRFMYSFGRKVHYNPIVGGFMHEEIDKGLYKLHTVLPGVIMEIEVTEEQYVKAKSLLDHFIANRNRYKYNYTGLLHSIIQKETCHETRFLCSEFVYYILKESGITELNKPRNLIKPQDLLLLKSKVIFFGNLKDVKYACRRNQLCAVQTVCQ